MIARLALVGGYDKILHDFRRLPRTSLPFRGSFEYFYLIFLHFFSFFFSFLFLFGFLCFAGNFPPSVTMFLAIFIQRLYIPTVTLSFAERGLSAAGKALSSRSLRPVGAPGFRAANYLPPLIKAGLLYRADFSRRVRATSSGNSNHRRYKPTTPSPHRTNLCNLNSFPLASS